MNLSNKRILVWDSGSFFETALKLADSFKEVLYFVPWTSGFPGMDKYVIGSEWVNGQKLETFDGKSLTRVSSFWDSLPECDIVLMCDCYDGDIATHVRSLGYPVVGAGKAEVLEQDRWNTKKLFKSKGMDMNDAKRIIGIDALRDYLTKIEDKYIKISRFRKQTETFHHETIVLTEPILSKMQHELGPLSKIMEFIVEDPIDAVVEEGYDGYSADGKIPSISMSGVEIKDLGYYGEISSYEKMSKGIQRTTNQILPILKDCEFRGFFSTEVRTTKNDENYLIDPTIRFPQPPSALYSEMFENLAEIIWELGQGNVIDVKPKGKCGLYATIASDWYDADAQSIHFPQEYRDNIKLNYPIKIDGNYYCLDINHHSECGAVVAVGDSFEDCKKQIEKIAESIKGYGICVKTDALDKAYEEFKKMQGDKK